MKSRKTNLKLNNSEINQQLQAWIPTIFIWSLILTGLSIIFPFDFSFNDGLSLTNVMEKFELDPVLGLQDSIEVAINLFLYSTVGFSLTGILKRRQTKTLGQLAIVFLVASALSVSGEIIQVFLPSRIPSVTDIISPIFGGLLGFGAFHLLRFKLFTAVCTLGEITKRTLSVPKLTIASIAYVVLTFAIAIALQNTTNLSNWNPKFPLLLGNEFSGNRPWHGKVYELCISNQAVSQDSIADIFAANGSCEAIKNSLVASYLLNGQGSYPDRTNQLPDLAWKEETPRHQNGNGVVLNSQHWLQTTNSAALMTQKIRETSQFTFSARIASAESSQSGPARIISLSGSPVQRNLTLGQEETNLSVRLRTPLMGENGERPEIIVPDVFADTHSHQLAIAYDGLMLRVYVDKIENLYAVKLTPETTLFCFFSGVLGRKIDLATFNPQFYKLLYYLLIFAPLGILLGAIATICKGSQHFYLLSLGGGLGFPAVMLEWLLAQGSQRSLQPHNVLISLTIGAIFMGLVKRARKS